MQFDAIIYEPYTICNMVQLYRTSDIPRNSQKRPDSYQSVSKWIWFKATTAQIIPGQMTFFAAELEKPENFVSSRPIKSKKKR